MRHRCKYLVSLAKRFYYRTETVSDRAVASAVLLPDAVEQASPTDLVTKRRQSTTSDASNKRPRLDREADVDLQDTTPAAGDLPSKRRRSGQVEERKRGQRLFGALLGTLSQSSSSTAQKRRVDIEKKQQAKLKLQAEEYDEKKKSQLDALLNIRRQEQKKYEKQSVCKLGHYGVSSFGC